MFPRTRFEASQINCLLSGSKLLWLWQSVFFFILRLSLFFLANRWWPLILCHCASCNFVELELLQTCVELHHIKSLLKATFPSQPVQACEFGLGWWVRSFIAFLWAFYEGHSLLVEIYNAFLRHAAQVKKITTRI